MDVNDDKTPVRPPPRPVDADAETLGTIELCLVELANASGQAAARIEALAAPDRVHVLALYRRRVEAVIEELRELAETIPKA